MGSAFCNPALVTPAVVGPQPFCFAEFLPPDDHGNNLVFPIQQLACLGASSGEKIVVLLLADLDGLRTKSQEGQPHEVWCPIAEWHFGGENRSDMVIFTNLKNGACSLDPRKTLVLANLPDCLL